MTGCVVPLRSDNPVAVDGGRGPLAFRLSAEQIVAWNARPKAVAEMARALWAVGTTVDENNLFSVELG